jgi:NADPH2:quinone reductase
MRAVVVNAFDSYDEATVAEVPDPEPGPTDVLVEIQAAPVNFVDLVTFQGGYQFSPDLPYIPGKCPVGRVVAVGSSVEHLGLGTPVLATVERGGYAQLVVADQGSVFPLPTGLGFVDAASMSLAFDTAWMALRDRAQLQAGESVLVLGASGAVGAAAIQLAKAMGAGTVLGGVSSFARGGSALKNGADGLVEVGGADPRNEIREQVRRLTGNGVDVVVDPVGGNAFDGAIRALAWSGRLVVVGFAAGRIPQLRMNYPLLKNIAISGLQISDYRKRRPDLMRICYEEIFRFAADGRVDPLPTTAFPLEQWHVALRRVGDRSAGSDRLVLLPGE